MLDAHVCIPDPAHGSAQTWLASTLGQAVRMVVLVIPWWPALPTRFSLLRISFFVAFTYWASVFLHRTLLQEDSDISFVVCHSPSTSDRACAFVLAWEL